MAIKKRNEQSKIVINLDGPDGNVFQLIAYAHRLGMQLYPEMDREQTKRLRDLHNAECAANRLRGMPPPPEPLPRRHPIAMQMMDGDYNDAIKVFQKYFGSVVDFETSDPDRFIN